MVKNAGVKRPCREKSPPRDIPCQPTPANLPRRRAMRAVVQRVSSARVTVKGATVGEIGAGLLVLLGVSKTDSAAAADYLAEKVLGLRIFEDTEGKMNLSVK